MILDTYHTNAYTSLLYALVNSLIRGICRALDECMYSFCLASPPSPSPSLILLLQTLICIKFTSCSPPLYLLHLSDIVMHCPPPPPPPPPPPQFYYSTPQITMYKPTNLIYFCLCEPHFLVLGWINLHEYSIVSPSSLVDVTELSLCQCLAEHGVSGHGALHQE